MHNHIIKVHFQFNQTNLWHIKETFMFPLILCEDSFSKLYKILSRSCWITVVFNAYLHAFIPLLWGMSVHKGCYVECN